MVKILGERNKLWYEVRNPYDKECDVCRKLNHIYTQNSNESSYILPQGLGKGYLTRIIPEKSMDVTIYDFTFYNRLTMEERVNDENCRISFCLAAPFEWSLEGAERTFSLGRDESCIFSGSFIHSTGCYEAGYRYQGSGVSLRPDKYAAIVEAFHSAQMMTHVKNMPILYRKFKITPSVKGIVQQIINCPYGDLLKNIYIEGKILELTAVYLNEMIYEKGGGEGKIRLVQQDIEGLARAREILERNFTEPMTISSLAKMVYMNEYKLKTGFKEVYGQSLYSYVVDKRMETARQLFDEKKMRVKEVAGMVGYTNISHFIEAFRKKFGVNPGVYLQNVM